MEIKLN